MSAATTTTTSVSGGSREEGRGWYIRAVPGCRDEKQIKYIFEGEKIFTTSAFNIKIYSDLLKN